MSDDNNTMLEAKKAVEALNAGFEAFKAANDENLKARDVVLEEKMAKINADLDAAQKVADDAVLAAIAALNDLSSADVTAAVPTVAQIWTTALTEAYRATGATGTASQLLYEVLQNLTEFTIAGTTKTVKQLDGSTTAKTYTLDDGTSPTGITEAT